MVIYTGMLQMSGHHGNKRGPSVSLTGTKVIATEMDRLRQSEVTYKAKIKAVSLKLLAELLCRLWY